MRKIIALLIITIVVVSGLVLTNCEVKEVKNEAKPSPNPLTEAQQKANLEERKKWEASPDGIQYKKWEASTEGKKVRASHDKIRKYIKDFSNMEAVVTSVTFQRENASDSSPKWLIVKIEDEKYMMQFIPKDFEKLKSLKVNDKIIVKSRNVGYSHNHPYLIISSDYIEQNNKVLFKSVKSKKDRC